MRQIDLPGRGFNVEEIISFSESLKKNFAPVRIRFYRADFPRSNFVRPVNVFRAEPGKANYITVHLNNREAIEFYKGMAGVGGNIFDENLTEHDVQIILNTLTRHRAHNVPAPAVRIEIPKIETVQKPFYSAIIEWFEKLIARLKS